MAENVKETAGREHNLAANIERMGQVHARAYDLKKQIDAAIEAHVTPLKEERKRLVKNACTDAGVNVKQFNRFHAIYQDERDAEDFEDQAEADKVKLGLEINYRALAQGEMVDWIKALQTAETVQEPGDEPGDAGQPAAPASDPLADPPADPQPAAEAKATGAKKAAAKKKVDLASPSPKPGASKPALSLADYKRWLALTAAHDTDEAVALMRLHEKGWATFSMQADLVAKTVSTPLTLHKVDDGGSGTVGVLLDTDAMDEHAMDLRRAGYDVALMMDDETATLQPAYEDA
jgi:hypothetical protein